MFPFLLSDKPAKAFFQHLHHKAGKGTSIGGVIRPRLGRNNRRQRFLKKLLQRQLQVGGTLGERPCPGADGVKIAQADEYINAWTLSKQGRKRTEW